MVTDIFNSGCFFFCTTTITNEVKLSKNSFVGTISMVIQAVELLLTLRQAFDVLSTPMLIVSLSFHIFLKKHSARVVQLCSLRCSEKLWKIYKKTPVTDLLINLQTIGLQLY